MAKDRWSLRNIYLYLVCLITLIMVIVGAVGFIRGTVELLYPDPYSVSRPIPVDGDKGMAEQDWEREQELSRESSRRYAVLSLVGNGALVLIAGPLYAYHWRKIETEHAEPRESEPAAGA